MFLEPTVQQQTTNEQTKIWQPHIIFDCFFVITNKQAKMQHSIPFISVLSLLVFSLLHYAATSVRFGLYARKPLKLIFRFVVAIGYFSIEITAIDHCVCV